MRKTLRLILATILAVGMATPVVAEEDNEIHIQTSQDLCDLAKNCALDTWSKGKRVILDNDISLAGADFTPIPVFNGTFDGNGHEITGLELLEDISPYGLFLETGPEAEIRLLGVSGRVEPGQDCSQIGGIVGVNRGSIVGSTFNGTVSGKDHAGGIAGVNESTGVISSCRSSGTVFALGNTGGIAGQNYGVIAGCDNQSLVNTQSIDPSLQLDAIDTSSLTNLINSITTENVDICNDIGGITGSNDGILELCTNSGVVGYLHLGTNIGGIAGRNGGFINRCVNEATVYGRYNTGGIVGRAEPLVEVTKTKDLVQGLSYRVETLNASIDIAVQDAGNSSNDLAYRIDQLHGYVTPIHFALTGDIVNDVEQARDIRNTIKDSVRGMADEIQNIGSSIDAGSATLNADLQAVSYNANALSDAAMQALNIISTGENMEEIVTDASIEPIESITMGKVADCANEGSVYSDRNAGGIAGILSIEENPDVDNLKGEGNRLTQNRYNLRCVIANCINRGVVTAKKECAGGIAGRMDFGLATRCEGYGEVQLEAGDYAGGICGLSYGNIRNCVAKCSLSAQRYVGGILGNGYNAKNEEEHNSETSDCISLVEIQGSPRFAAAISGGAQGSYSNNRFCSDSYAGLDKINIQGMAEQVGFDAIAQQVPEECRNFTLSFIVDGETVKAIPFAYGESFDQDVYPEIPQKDGMYVSWDKTDLSNLTSDTKVTATYCQNTTVLDASLARKDGRMAVYVDGLFQQGDAMSVQQLPIEKGDEEAFHTNWQDTVQEQLQSMLEGHPDYTVCTSVVEKLRITIPEDGQTEHQIRYLPPEGSETNSRLFLHEETGWTRIETENFGSYLTFSASGTQAEIALVQTIQSWWIVAYAVVAILALIGIIALAIRIAKKLRSRPKKQKQAKQGNKHGLAIAACVCAILALAGTLLFIKLEPSLAVGKMIKDLAKEETAIHTEISIHANDRTLPVSTTAYRINNDGEMITCADAFGIPLYFHEGEVFFENGRSFRVRSHLDHGTIMGIVQKIFSDSNIQKEKADGIVTYRCEIHDASADELLAMFLGNTYQDTLHANDLSLELSASKGKIQKLVCTGKGTMADDSPFEIKASFTPEELTEHPVIPQKVLSAMTDKDTATEILTEDMLAMFAAWMKFDESENIDATISVQAEAGPLSINNEIGYFRQKVNGTNLHCVSTPLLTTYFTDKAIYASDGTKLLNTENRNVDPMKLIEVAHELSLNGKMTCDHDGDSRVFTLSLDANGAEKLAETLLPMLKKELPITYGDNALSIHVEKGKITSIAYQCMGTVKIVTRKLDTQINVSVQFLEEQVHEIPQAIQDELSN